MVFAPWKRLLQWRGMKPRSEAPRLHGMGLDQLPEDVRELPVGSPAALLWPSPTWARHWAPAAIEDALQAGPVMVLAQEAVWVDELLQRPGPRQAYDQRRLSVWLTSDRMVRQVRQQGWGPVLAELAQEGLTSDHALWVVGDHAWLLEQDGPHLWRMANQLRRWCARRSRPVVFGFQSVSELSEIQQSQTLQEVMLRLHNFHHTFHHIAILMQEAGHPILWVDRWSGPHGAVFQHRYGLHLDEAKGRLGYDGTWMRGHELELMEAPDQHDVIATAQAVAGQRGVPVHWRILEGLDAVAPALRHHIAATVVLHAGRAEDSEALARLIHHLRTTHPRTLKILVRENLGKLRAHSEQAFLRLGANAIIYREVGFARLLQKIRDLNMVAFKGDVPDDPTEVLTGYAPEPLRGYQPPRAFVEAVLRMVSRSAPYGLVNSLVRLPMRPQIPHLDALRACTLVRDGDLLTADHDALYLFLFACTEADLAPALERLFAVPLDHYFFSQIHDHSLGGIEALLQPLRDSGPKTLPDYSDALPSPVREAKSETFVKLEPKAQPVPSVFSAPVYNRAPPVAFPRPIGQRVLSVDVKGGHS